MDTAVWNTAAFSALILNSTLLRAPLVLALRLRALLFRPPPTSVHYYTCDYCDAHVDHSWSHVARSSPLFLVRSQWTFVRLLATVPKLAGSYLPDGTTVVQPASNASIMVTRETDLHTPSPLPPHRWTVFSPSGLVRSAHPSSEHRTEQATVFVLSWRRWLTAPPHSRTC